MPCSSVPRGSAVLFPSKKHVDATRAFASGFRGRKDGKERRKENEKGLGGQKRKGRRRQEVTILLSVVAPQRRQPPALPPFRAVPSALAGLTSLFGMGRGVAPPRRRRFVFPEPHKRDPVCRERELRNEETNVIGLLVRVGSVHRCTCTSRLSTW